MPQLTGAEVLVRIAQAEGMPLAFGIASGKLTPLMHALSRQTEVGFVGVRHEASAAIAAAACYASTGRVSLALGEMGPGALNLAAGAGVARNNHLAALLVTTNQHRMAAYPHRGMFMDLDTQALMAPLTKWRAVVHDGRRLAELLRTALREALSGAPGPVHLDIPQDVLAGTVDLPDALLQRHPAASRATAPSRPAADAVREAAQLLRAAKRPLIVAGGGVVSSGAVAELRALAALLQAPVLPTQMAVGVVPSGSPQHIGHGGLIAGEPVRQAFEQADLVLAVGTRFSSWLWDENGPMATPARHRIVALNIDAAALGEPVPHDVALLGDARAGLQDLLSELQATAGPTATDPAWLPTARGWRLAHEARLRALAAEAAPAGQAGMHPAALAQALGQALPADALVAYDGGHTSFWSNDLMPVAEARTRFHDPGMCQLGFGLPYALALQALHPQRPVLQITGDGSFGFTLPELDTARRYRLPVVSVVHNNAAWGVIRAGQRAQHDFEFHTGLEGTDYAAIARGFGCHGERVERVEDVAPALQRALASGLPAVLDCQTRWAPHPCMPLFGRMNRFGS
jgi:thiamine pyrophosphate-dependent acetolactate synthase large subunit-like protein